MPKRIKYNPADRIADLAVVRMQDRIKEIYAEAERDITRKMNEFTQKFAKRDAQYRADVAAGKIAQADYDAWRRGQVFQDEQWKAAKREMTAQIRRANQTAAGIVNGERRAVFQKNANYAAYQIERRTKGAVNFSLYDSATVTRLLENDKKLLPEYKINEVKDYKWNNSKVNNAVTQSIIQGESFEDLTKRLTHSLEAGNRSTMMTFARTAMTGAQNAGRIEAMHDAEDMGIKVQKRWIATLDSHTRDTHAELDGQVVDVDEPFTVDGMEIMFPGDPNADPALVYNCRCTLGYEYPDVATGIGRRRDNETSDKIEGMTYKEWEKMKQGEQETPYLDDFTPVELIGGSGDAEITDNIRDYYLPKATRDRLDEIESLDTYNKFRKYLDKNYNVKLDTGLDVLKGARADDSISAVKEQCQKITIAIDAYRETFGDDALSSLKKVYLYDRDLDVRAAYFFNMVGENDPLAGEIHFSQWGDDGRTIFHELAHAYQDSHKLPGEDAITYSERVIRDLGEEGLSAYSGASKTAYAAEQFADAFGFGFSQGSESGQNFIERVAEYEHRRRHGKR